MMNFTKEETIKLLGRIEDLALISEQEDGLTRLFLTKEHRLAAEKVAGWMTEAGMDSHIDAVGNVVGRYEGSQPGLPCLMFGSHLDSVRNAGKFDGPLGVLAPLACIEKIHSSGHQLPFAIEILGFGDEEGVRFPSVLMGSRAVAGTFNYDVLELTDKEEISVGQAMRDFGLDLSKIGTAAYKSDDVLAYVEFHIEQGPVLESEELPVGVVSAINGQNRFVVEILGIPGHAGTVPMNLRRDALSAAAECILVIEKICNDDTELVGTVGSITAKPGIGNAIAGNVEFNIDIRGPDDAKRLSAIDEMKNLMGDVCKRRDLLIDMKMTFESDSCPCAPFLIDQLESAIISHDLPVRRLPSGAGHDGMAMIDLTNIAMLFLRCEKGISHNPAESVTLEDVRIGVSVLKDFIENFKPA